MEIDEKKLDDSNNIEILNDETNIWSKITKSYDQYFKSIEVKGKLKIKRRWIIILS